MWEISAAVIGASGNIAGIFLSPSFFKYELPVMQGRREYMCGGGMNVRKGGSTFYISTF